MVFKAIRDMREKIPRLITYWILIIIFALVATFILPLLSFLKEMTIFPNLNLYQAINLFFVASILFLIFELWRSLSPILKFLVERFYAFLPGSKKIEKTSVKRILYDLAYIIIIILIITSIPIPLSQMIEIGNIFNFFGLIAILILLFDSMRTTYDILSSKIEKLNKKLNPEKEEKEQIPKS
jgi:hypothetical protein